jgi:hypothetical protein
MDHKLILPKASQTSSVDIGEYRRHGEESMARVVLSCNLRVHNHVPVFSHSCATGYNSSSVHVRIAFCNLRWLSL